MCTRGWNAVVCPSEVDIAIMGAYQSNDVVVSTDSAMLAYDTVIVIWRAISRRWFLIYDIVCVLQSLGLTRRQLTVLCLVSKNDYACNLARMGVFTNFKVIKSSEKMVRALLSLQIACLLQMI
jgi:hypothetical protein